MPAANGARKSHVSPNMCDSGSTDRRRSFGPNGKTSTRVRAFEATLPWVSITPFGSPVVPDVNITRNRSSAETSAAGIGSAPWARSGSDSIRITGRPSRRAGSSVWRDASTSFGPVCSTTLVAKSSVLRTSSGTATSPACAAARNPSPHSGRLTAQIATRSPRVAPASCSARAILGTWCPMSRYRQMRVRKPGLIISAGRGPNPSTDRWIRPLTVSMCASSACATSDELGQGTAAAASSRSAPLASSVHGG